MEGQAVGYARATRRATRRATLVVLAALITMSLGCGPGPTGRVGEPAADEQAGGMASVEGTKSGGGEEGGAMFEVSSSAYGDKGRIPLKYCMTGAGGENASPPLTLTGEPRGTRSYVLAMIDRHRVANDWVHWVVAGMPPGTGSLAEGVSGKEMPAGSRELKNTFGSVGYGGPQPPPGTGDHPYEIIVWALDTDSVSLPAQPSAADLERAVAGRVLGKATLTGYFGR